MQALILPHMPRHGHSHHHQALVCLHLFASLKEKAEAAPISMEGVQIQVHQMAQNISQQTRKC